MIHAEQTVGSRESDRVVGCALMEAESEARRIIVFIDYTDIRWN